MRHRHQTRITHGRPHVFLNSLIDEPPPFAPDGVLRDFPHDVHAFDRLYSSFDGQKKRSKRERGISLRKKRAVSGEKKEDENAPRASNNTQHSYNSIPYCPNSYPAAL